MSDSLLKLMDVAIGAMNTVGRVNQLISAARAEGRDVTDAEVDALVAESDSLRRGFEDAGPDSSN